MTIEDRINFLARKPRMFNKDMTPEQNILSIYYLCLDYLQGKIMAEIGCYSGGSTEVFASMCRKVYAIDAWDRNTNVKQDGKVNLKKAKKLFYKKIKKYKNIIVKEEVSSSAHTGFMDSSLDAIYIDGDHSMGGVAKDFIMWYPKIKTGGFICGHDYNDENIRTLIHEIVGHPIKTYLDSSWVVKKVRKFIV